MTQGAGVTTPKSRLALRSLQVAKAETAVDAMPAPQSANPERQPGETSRAEKEIAASGASIAQSNRHRPNHEAPEYSGNYQRKNRRRRDHNQRAVTDRDASDNADRDKTRRRQPGCPAATLDSLQPLPFFTSDHQRRYSSAYSVLNERSTNRSANKPRAIEPAKQRFLAVNSNTILSLAIVRAC
jgi:hypothetical protein